MKQIPKICGLEKTIERQRKSVGGTEVVLGMHYGKWTDSNIAAKRTKSRSRRQAIPVSPK
jgi:hypothetical protein